MKLQELLTEFQSAIIGTIGENGYPFSSYAPFYYDGELVYIFVSGIATHTKNLDSRPKASLLFIEDEEKSKNIFARRRISLQCDAHIVPREETAFECVMMGFKNKFDPEMVSMLIGMKDFNLYTLRPIYGEATFGFGEAYHIGGEQMNELVPRRGSGHKSH